MGNIAEPETLEIRGVRLFITDELADELTALLDRAVGAGGEKTSQPVGLDALISTDQNGLIMRFSPPNGTKWELIWFIQNLMIQQRLYLLDSIARKEGLIK